MHRNPHERTFELVWFAAIPVRFVTCHVTYTIQGCTSGTEICKCNKLVTNHSTHGKAKCNFRGMAYFLRGIPHECSRIKYVAHLITSIIIFLFCILQRLALNGCTRKKVSLYSSTMCKGHFLVAFRNSKPIIQNECSWYFIDLKHSGLGDKWPT